MSDILPAFNSIIKIEMKLLMITAALVLSGCANLKEAKEQETLFVGEIKGDYAALARCVAAKMQTDKRQNINTLQYTVRVYPDANRSEVLGTYANNTYYGASYAFDLQLKKAVPNASDVLLKGRKYEGVEALKALQICSESMND